MTTMTAASPALRVTMTKGRALALLLLSTLTGPSGCLSRRPPAAPSEAQGAAVNGREAQGAAAVEAQPESKGDIPVVMAAKARPVSGQRVAKISKSDAEWRAQLTPEQYQVMRQKGTERAYTGPSWDEHGKGIYVCAACGLELFRSDEKFDSGTGWPSFWQPAAPQSVETDTDQSLGMKRVEVHCSRCGGHLGHIFEDGPRPTGLRYCINGTAMKFVAKK